MSDQNLQEIWQVEAGGQIYEAPFGELPAWIAEGSLLPQDKVRRGNLRWIEARKVPSLVPFFNAKALGRSAPTTIISTSTGSGSETFPDKGINISTGAPSASSGISNFVNPDKFASAAPTPDTCANHPNMPAVYLCGGCGKGFCGACPSRYGTEVRICPACGSMCRQLAEVHRTNAEEAKRRAALSEGFGAADFFNAVRHPWKFGTSLFFGAVMFAFFAICQSASSFGGIMMVGAIFCVMLANMLTFGILANTVDNFSRGNVAENFMPSFDDFSLWDDVVHPFFLSIGAYAVSFGPFFLVLAVGLYIVFNSAASHMDAVRSDLEKLPGTHYYDNQKTVEQSEAVKKVIGDISNKQRRRLVALEEAAAGNTDALVQTDESNIQAAENAAAESRKAQLESAFGKSPEIRAVENEAMLQGFLKLAPPLVVIGAILFLWGVFYFPAACAVAGYTRSFGATINPTAGLDTIKRLRMIYVKILAMCLVLVFAAAVISGAVGMLFSPFDLPVFGNLPAKAIGAVFTFYVWIVFSCILGFALLKASDRLALPR